MARKRSDEIVICVVTKSDIARFVAYDIVLGWSAFFGLKLLRCGDLAAMAGSTLIPVLLRRAVHGRGSRQRDRQRSRQGDRQGDLQGDRRGGRRGASRDDRPMPVVSGEPDGLGRAPEV